MNLVQKYYDSSFRNKKVRPGERVISPSGKSLMLKLPAAQEDILHKNKLESLSRRTHYPGGLFYWKKALRAH